jgi:quinate dehydrogenase (quinone)
MKMGRPKNRVAESFARIFGIALLTIGAVLTLGGINLALVGGSFYYIIAGLALLVSGFLYVRLSPTGFFVYAAIFALTIVWAFWEVGPQFWPLVPRLVAPSVLACVALLLVPSFTRERRLRYIAFGGFAVILAGLAAMGISAFHPHGVIRHAGIRRLTTCRQGHRWNGALTATR